MNGKDKQGKKEIREIFACRLKQARMRAKLTMEGLCRRLDGAITKQTVSKYEQGKMMPDSNILIKFCEVLEQDADFFFRPIRANLEQVEFSFRKRSIGATELNALKAGVVDDMERNFEINEILGLREEPFIPVRPVVERITNIDEMEACARKVREEWMLGQVPISNVQTLLEENGINVIMFDGIPKFDGTSTTIEGRPVIVLNKNVKMVERQRFTAMHELGHILFNSYFDEELSDREVELLCHAFASEMLLPTEVVKKHFGYYTDVTFEALYYLQARFGISPDAIMHKLRELEIIDRNQYRRFCINKSTKSTFKGQMETSRFHEDSPSEFETKVNRALERKLITQSRATVLLGPSYAKKQILTNYSM
ncbi:MAG: ImmA/IrrE family metallo-endopeptidase [Bacteroidales bacterium]|nr:ImmA/IrrE family metallo-endopeptidase [Bacteroidales bacterium]